MFPSLFLRDILCCGVSGQRIRCCFPGVILTRAAANFRAFEGVVTVSSFRGDLDALRLICSGFPSSNARFLLTITFVFLGDFVLFFLALNFLALNFSLCCIRPVVETLDIFFDFLPSRLISRERDVSKLLGRDRKLLLTALLELELGLGTVNEH